MLHRRFLLLKTSDKDGPVDCGRVTTCYNLPMRVILGWLWSFGHGNHSRLYTCPSERVRIEHDVQRKRTLWGDWGKI